ncbi:MAG: cation-translocating P-type ATPase [Chloroflexota bacterium]
MDCAECTAHVRRAIAALPGVAGVEVLLAAEKAVVHFDPARVDVAAIRSAIEGAGYRAGAAVRADGGSASPEHSARPILRLLAVVFGTVLLLVVVGEWLGLLDRMTEWIPWPVWLGVVVAGGYRVFRGVVRSALRGQITSHALMTLGAVAAMAVGEWATAAVVVFFMRVGDSVESFTTERARRAVKDLASLAPQVAQVVRSGEEVEIPAEQVQPGEIVVVRPGERIPVDGEVIAGQATVDQATITGESMPVEAGPGARVYAATLAQLGSLRIRATGVGQDTTFGRVVRSVQEAEAHRADVQRLADRFSGYYLPLVVGVAAMTFLLTRNPLATAAVLVVACSCSFALATPIAMLATIGAAARGGLLIKGGKYIEALARADVVLIDKTGTLTLGRPQITDVIPLDDRSASELLWLAASAERYSEHPLAEAVRTAARERKVTLAEPMDFEALPGMGVRARVDGQRITVGSRRTVAAEASLPVADELEAQGKTLLLIACDGHSAGVLAAADTLRPEVPAALSKVRDLGIRRAELLTGDHERTARSLAEPLGLGYRANLLPEDKISVVKAYQAKGHVVVMVSDGVNDAPALAQADVGIAMGAAGSAVAVEAGHITLMRDDWELVPEVLRLARRTMRVVRLNLAFTVLYNALGLTLAALGLLPPALAAAAQSLPDLGILANSARLLRRG